MQTPLIVGILVAIIFLTAFSEWAYHLVKGWGEIVLDDAYFRYRMLGVTLGTIFLISATFVGMAFVAECPNEEREGVFAKLNCEEYLKIKVSTEKLFRSEAETVPEQ